MSQLNGALECDLNRIIIDNTGTDKSPQKIDYNQNLVDLGVDSVSFIKIVVAIETEYGFEFEDEFLNYSKFSTFYSLLWYIEERLKELKRG